MVWSSCRRSGAAGRRVPTCAPSCVGRVRPGVHVCAACDAGGAGGCEVTERAPEGALLSLAPPPLPHVVPERAGPAASGGRRQGSGAALPGGSGFRCTRSFTSRDSKDTGFHPRSGSAAVTRVRGRAGPERVRCHSGREGLSCVSACRTPSGAPER